MHILTKKTLCLFFITVTGSIKPMQVAAKRAEQSTTDQLIIEYAQTDNMAGVVKMLSQGVPIDTRGFTGFTALHMASGKGLTKMVRFLLQRGAKLDARNQSGWTPLHMAATAGQTEVVEILLNNDAEIDEANGNGTTALHCAAIYNHVHTTRLLLQRGAARNPLNENKFTPLQASAQKGNADIVELFLEYGAEPDEKSIAAAQAGKHYTAAARLLLKAGIKPTEAHVRLFPTVHKAAEEGLNDVVRFLLTGENCAINSLDASGFAPLHYAAGRGRLVIINLLIDAGADTALKSKDGAAPLHIAVDDNQRVSVLVLLARGADCNVRTVSEERTALHLAAGFRKAALVRDLLERGAQVDAKDEDDSTPLHYATQEGDKEIITILAQANADLNAHREKVPEMHVLQMNDPANAHLNVMQILQQMAAGAPQGDYSGASHTALHMAVSQNDRGLVEHLLGLGADSLQTDNGGNTPLHRACVSGYQDIAELLLGKEQSLLERTNKEGCTALISAVDGGHTELVRFLLSKGADSSTHAKEGWSVLHLAIQKQNEDIVVQLLDKGANTEAADANECTALFHAVYKCNVRLVTLLLERRANPLAPDRAGYTAAHRAAEKGDCALIECFLSQGVAWDIRAKGKTLLHCAASFCRTEACQLLQRWIVRQKLTSACTVENRNKVWTLAWVLKNLDLPHEVSEGIVSATTAARSELILAAAYGLTGPKFFQNLLKRMGLECGSTRAKEILSEYAQTCLTGAYALLDDDNCTAYARALPLHNQLAEMLNPAVEIHDSTIKEWIALEQKMHGSIAQPEVLQEPKKVSVRKSKAVPNSEEIKHCLACNKTEKLMRCGNCKKVYFCNGACQKKAWAQHKTQCKKG